MDAAELLAGDGVFVVDTSSWWRVASLPPRTRALVQDALREDRFRITPIVRMEILYSARSSAEYVAIERARRAPDPAQRQRGR